MPQTIRSHYRLLAVIQSGRTSAARQSHSPRVLHRRHCGQHGPASAVDCVIRVPSSTAPAIPIGIEVSKNWIMALAVPLLSYRLSLTCCCWWEVITENASLYRKGSGTTTRRGDHRGSRKRAPRVAFEEPRVSGDELPVLVYHSLIDGGISNFWK